MLCENCGAPNDQNAAFCCRCGKKLELLPVEPEKKSGSNKVIIVVIIFLLLIAATVVGVFLVKKKNKDAQERLETMLAIEEEEDTVEMELPEEEIEETKLPEEESETTVKASPINMYNITDVQATSVLVEKARTHYADRIIDGDLSAAWTEGADGHGIGESVTLYFDDTYEVKGFYIHAGYHKSEKLYWENARPRVIEIICDGRSCGEYSLRDYFGEQEIAFDKPVETDYLTILIKDVFVGTKYEDAVISEIYLY